MKQGDTIEAQIRYRGQIKQITILKIDHDKKTVTLTWEDTLENNTTYSIYLNETVQDITESNDSLMVFVFSTGDYIDSLSYQVKVIDAFTSQLPLVGSACPPVVAKALPAVNTLGPGILPALIAFLREIFTPEPPKSLTVVKPFFKVVSANFTEL